MPAGFTTAGAELSVAAVAGAAAPTTAMVAARRRADASFFIVVPKDRLINDTVDILDTTERGESIGAIFEKAPFFYICDF